MSDTTIATQLDLATEPTSLAVKVRSFYQACVALSRSMHENDDLHDDSTDPIASRLFDHAQSRHNELPDNVKLPSLSGNMTEAIAGLTLDTLQTKVATGRGISELLSQSAKTEHVLNCCRTMRALAAMIRSERCAYKNTLADEDSATEHSTPREVWVDQCADCESIELYALVEGILSAHGKEAAPTAQIIDKLTAGLDTQLKHIHSWNTTLTHAFPVGAYDLMDPLAVASILETASIRGPGTTPKDREQLNCRAAVLQNRQKSLSRELSERESVRGSKACLGLREKLTSIERERLCLFAARIMMRSQASDRPARSDDFIL